MSVDHQTVALFAEALKARGKQPATIESYCRDAQRFLNYMQSYRMPLSLVEPSTLLSYQDHLRSQLEERDNSVRRTVIGVRQFFRYLSETGVIHMSPFDSVPIPLRDEALPKDLSPEDVEHLLTLCEKGRPAFKAARDAALLALLAFEGIKAGELTALRWADLLGVGSHASLHISGSRARSIKLSPQSLDYLCAYRLHYERLKHPVLLRAVDPRMFIAFKGREASSPLPLMSRHGLKFILYELGTKVDLPKLNTEQLRHHAVNYLIHQGIAPAEIMRHMGLRRLGNIAKHLAQSAKSAPLSAPQETALLPLESPRPVDLT